MKTIHLNSNHLNHWQEKAHPNVMVLGFFDGIHRGHCEVIHTAARIAQEKKVPLSLMSFFPHPQTILSKGSKQVNYLMPLSKKKEILQKMGVDIFYIVEFNECFASISPEQFVAQYLLKLGVVHAVAGYDFSYGAKGKGNVDDLGKDFGHLIEVTKVGKEALNGEKISSTSIRQALLAGHIEKSNALLGYAYEIECKWDGETFSIQPYYTLPAIGVYEVTIKHNCFENRAVMQVVNKNEQIVMDCLTKMPQSVTGMLTIVWHRRF